MKFIPAKFCHDNKTQYICTTENKKHAVIAQLVEWKLPKLQVASSSLVYRSQKNVGTQLHVNIFTFHGDIL